MLKKYTADFELELSQINVVVTPDSLIVEEFIREAVKEKCVIHTTKYLTVAFGSCVKPEFSSAEVDTLIKDEFEKMNKLAKEMNLKSEVYIPADKAPLVKAIELAFNQPPGTYLLIALHPEVGVDPVGAFVIGHIAAVAVQKLWEKGVKLHLIAISNSLDFIRGVTTSQTNIYIIKREQLAEGEYLYTAERWNRFDIIPPFFDSAALAIKRGILF